jgi:hypothetical protein
MKLDLEAIARLGNGPSLEPPPIFEMPPDIPDLDGTLDQDYPPTNDLDVKAREFLRANPIVWALMWSMAKMMVDKRVRFGMKMLVEVARWQHIRKTVDPNQNKFKLSNSYTSYIVRLLIHFCPEVEDYVILKGVRE